MRIMDKVGSLESETADREIIITRVFEARREVVFDAWTDAKRIGEWWGPTGFTTTTQEIDIRPGGLWRFVMHGPDGTDYPNLIVYQEIVRPERLVFNHGSGEEDSSDEFLTVVTFEDRDGKTALTMRSIFASKEARDWVVSEYHAIDGSNQTLDRLGEYLAKAM